MSKATFPGSIWPGTSEDRPNGATLKAPSGKDWLRLVDEINAVEKVLDGIGLSTTGTFVSSDPSKTSQLYTDGAGTDEVQNLAEINATSGTWTLTVTLPGNDPVTTAAVDFEATASELETAIDDALDGLSVNGEPFVAGDIAVTGTDINAAGGLTLTFSGDSVDAMDHTIVVANDVDLDTMTPPVESTTTPGVSSDRLTLSGAGTATYPNVWDGLTSSRVDRDDDRAPDADDWLAVVQRVQLLQERVQPLGLNSDGTIPTGDATGLYANNGFVSVVGQASTDIWDGTSRTRPDPDVRRAPDNIDYLTLYQKLHDLQARLVPLGLSDLGAVPTSDPAVAGELWTSSGTLKVSAG